MEQVFQWVLDALDPLLDPLMDIIRQGFSDLNLDFDAIPTSISNVIEDVFNEITSFIPDEFNLLNATLDGLFDKLFFGLGAVFPQLDLSIGSLSQSIIDLATNITTTLDKELGINKTTLEDFIKNKFIFLDEDLTDLEKDILTSVQGFIDPIEDWIDDAKDNLQNFVDNELTDVSEDLQAGIRDLSSDVGASLDVLFDALDPIAGTLISVGKTFLEGITALFTFDLSKIMELQEDISRLQAEKLKLLAAKLAE